MSDTPVHDHDDRVDDVEALLREITEDDLDLAAPPDDVWDGISAALGDEAVTDASRNVVSLTHRRSQFSPRFLAAAAAVACIAVGAVVVASIRGDDATVVASATLEYDAEAFDPLGADASATAELVERGDGFEIRLDEAVLPDPGAEDLELWLISTDDDGEITDVQPVSLVDADTPGTYAVPAELDPDVYTVVDISVEPRDGDETHSGRSILRGTLDA